MDHLYWLDQIQPSDRSVVGDKAFYLAHLLQRGYPVVPGFVVAAPVFNQFLESVDWLEPLFADLPHSFFHLDIENPYQLQAIAQQIRQAILSTDLPEDSLTALTSALASFPHAAGTPLILRPSITLQAGQASKPVLKTAQLLESQICPAQGHAIALALKQLWAEFFRARSLFYWQRSGIQLQQINFAVLVQPLQTALVSGSLQMNSTDLEIHASWGLGMAHERGEVLSDYYHIRLADGVVQGQRLGSKTIAYDLDGNGQIAARSDRSLEQLTANRDWMMADSGLQAYLLHEDLQSQSTLEPSDLNELSQLAQQVKADLETTFVLEWVLDKRDRTSPQLAITQVYPYILPLVHSEVDASHRAVQAALPASEPSSGDPIQDAHRQFVAAGLAASSGKAIAPAQVILDSMVDPQAIAAGTILVAPSITPDWLPLLKQAAGIVAEQGGMTCHGAIIARELGIPAVVGAANATKLIATGAFILVDGDQGTIHQMDSVPASDRLQRLHREASDPSSHFANGSTGMDTALSHPSFNQPLATQLLVNLSQPASIERSRGLPVDGVGLLRSELLILDLLEHQHPDLWLQQGRQAELVERLVHQISKFAQAFAPRPVLYRALDLRSDEFRALKGGEVFPPDANPMLGLRGAFRYLLDPALFDLELQVLKQVRQLGYRNLHLMLPFVRSVEEFVACRQRVEQVGLVPSANFQLWMMAEVPSVLFLLPDYVAAGVQGISIGTNDLTQLILGVDRHQSRMASVFDERHPAVMQAIAQLIRQAQQAGIPCSICGHAPAQHPEMIDSLVQWGVTSISVNPDAVEQTYHAIARAEHRLLLAAARKQLSL